MCYRICYQFFIFFLFYSELNLNRYGVGSPCRTICTVCGSPPCPDLNLIHYISYAYLSNFSPVTR
ncbi:hypothetical protein COI33_03120 [Neisseria meningitidis]|uniref:Secreted protein n=1 Tax=Neisseria meningitidis TaxID=487 RepID=A0AB37K7G0_NEIME|nr:hypothetical protein [Neisseria meningitidis]MBJ7814374.1 hypothetical protein [Neisseria meningitidis]MCG8958252.1 hypothetical protein [Neisseria meningitidis]MCG8962034.1 hypothetical protein [Neisseria meningitidis]MCG8972237.1 hypothetical protein [Neisseria meningitidis]